MSLPDYLLPPRAERYRAQLLDDDDNLIRDLHEFTRGEYELNMFADIHGGGSVDLIFDSEEAYNQINWGRDRIMVWFTPDRTAPIQEGIEWPMGVFLIEAPEQVYNDDLGTISTTVNLMDKLAVLAQDCTEESFSLPEGTPVVQTVQDIILARGETKIAVTDSDLTLPIGKVWDGLTPWLTIVNDLLSTINYQPLWCDGYGVYRVSPQPDPAQRTPKYTLASGQASVHLPEWNRAQNWFDVPNRWIITTEATDTEPSIEVSASNVNGNDGYPYEYSIEARGRVIAGGEQDAQGADLEVLTDRARRALMSASQRVANLTVQHAHLPLWFGDVIAYQVPEYRGLARVSKFSVTMEPGALVTGTWREVDRIYG